MGLANINGRGQEAAKHLAKVNKWNEITANKYIKEQFSVWLERSKCQWSLDITWLDTIGINCLSLDRENTHKSNRTTERLSEKPPQSNVEDTKKSFTELTDELLQKNPAPVFAKQSKEAKFDEEPAAQVKEVVIKKPSGIFNKIARFFFAR